jgi:hypothetical protein
MGGIRGSLGRNLVGQGFLQPRISKSDHGAENEAHAAAARLRHRRRLCLSRWHRWITIYLVGREGLPEDRLDDAMVLRLLYLYTFIKAGIK